MQKNQILFIFIIIFLSSLIFGFLYFQKKPSKMSTPLKETVFQPSQKMKISSSAFVENSFIPEKYTCDGQNINPPLTFEEVPNEAKSLVLIVDDPDAPRGIWTHWIVFNIDPKTKFVEENSFPEGAIQGLNDFGENKYGGPCPPSGTHRYFFRLYALDTTLDLLPNVKRDEVLKAIEGHVIASSELIGLYQRQWKK